MLDFTDGKGVDLAIDSYGATMLDRTFDVVKKLGHVISIGEAEGQPFKNIRERILPRSQTFTRLHLGHVDQASPAWQAGVDHVLAGIAAGWLKVPIEGVFPLEPGRRDASAAGRASRRGQAAAAGRAALIADTSSFDVEDSAGAAELDHLGAIALGRADADQDEIGIVVRSHQDADER